MFFIDAQRLLGKPRRLLGVLFFLALAVCGQVFAQDHITQRAWLEDETGRLGVTEVQQQATTRFEGPLSLGYGPGVVWLRLSIDPALHRAAARLSEHLVLRIRPVYLDSIQVFDPLAPQGAVRSTGDLQHPRQAELQGMDFLLPIPRGETSRDIWLRLSTQSTRQIDVQALAPDDLTKVIHTEAPITALYIGLICILSVWGLVHGLLNKEPLISSFGLKQLAALLYALASLGYLRLVWPISWPAAGLDLVATIASILGVSSAVLFHVILQREFDPPPWVRRVHLGMLVLQPVKLLMLMAGMTISALRLNMLEVLLLPVVFLVSVLLARGWQPQSRQRPSLPKWAAVGFYLVMLGFMLLAAMPGLGLMDGDVVALYVVQTHGLISAFLVLLILNYRAHVMRKRQRETAIALERSLMQAQQEREMRHEQDNLLAMLAHELKTPLATMYMRLDASSAGTQAIKQAIQDMNGVIERCLEAAKLSDRQLRPRLEPLDLLDALREAVSACRAPERVTLTCPPGITIHSDPQLIFLALSNLLENACKYAAPNTPITVNGLAPTGEGEAVRVSIANQPGIAGWPDASQVFQKYYRSPHARRQAGTGLGLFLVQNLMYAIGGKIAYQPSPSHVQFVLLLPGKA